MTREQTIANLVLHGWYPLWRAYEIGITHEQHGFLYPVDKSEHAGGSRLTVRRYREHHVPPQPYIATWGEIDDDRLDLLAYFATHITRRGRSWI